MYCSQLSILKDLMNENEIEKLELYFASLSSNTKDRITASGVSNHVNLPFEIALKALIECYKAGILGMKYVLVCPECDCFLKEITGKIEEVEGRVETCYHCEEEFEVTEDDILLMFSLEGDSNPFTKGRYENDESCVRGTAQAIGTEYNKKDTFSYIKKTHPKQAAELMSDDEIEKEVRRIFIRNNNIVKVIDCIIGIALLIFLYLIVISDFENIGTYISGITCIVNLVLRAIIAAFCWTKEQDIRIRVMRKQDKILEHS